ncbi:uncharacterized protein C3orf85-like [Erpetoichthys calabaricus]|uniref:Uncharacterized protein n=1 Tax=Erpetoichthys calabaricus TaxID=27687 RepID=A0A8C4S2D0_ERPCA|nr:uncharacterized protein C3orf85-like [Erpetoichthys calabaricus]
MQLLLSHRMASFTWKQAAIVSFVLSGVLSAPFMQEEDANQFIRLKRQAQYTHDGYWDPNGANNVWGYTIREQANEYWNFLRTTAQYYMDMGAFFDASVADENNRLYMDMLRNVGAHIHGQAEGN